MVLSSLKNTRQGLTEENTFLTKNKVCCITYEIRKKHEMTYNIAMQIPQTKCAMYPKSLIEFLAKSLKFKLIDRISCKITEGKILAEPTSQQTRKQV